MNTLKDRGWSLSGVRAAEESWAQTCAGLGSVAWATIAILARLGLAPIGAIELIFLFAPLVIVPLGMELARVMGTTGPIDYAARRLLPFAAGLAVLALWLPPGKTAAAFACAWMLICSLIAVSTFVDLVSARFSASRLAISFAGIDLAVGGAWFVASRLGIRPMGIQEPIGLLTAIHFHFAGFATGLIAAATLRFSDIRNHRRWLNHLVTLVALMPLIVAAGFVISPLVKMIAGVLFSLSVALLAIFLRSCATRAQSRGATIFLQIAAVSVFAGMVLSSIYAIADFRGSDVLPIPQMARTHGVLNAVGFCMCALLGWLIEFNENQDDF